ncbi:bifunctional 23S rRNA (guanine(2069)-N(7))-methyltransferase RlmK/23S rRNA (guanine(2445)-N(2))-methyltransferase RlmL [Magnetococcales bacterium HHB-1]
MFKVVCSAPWGISAPLQEELLSLGVVQLHNSPFGWRFMADHTLLCRLLIWSRLASRITLILYEGPGENDQQLYQHASQIAWHEHLSDSFKVLFSGTNAQLRDTRYSTRRIKDAVMDHYQKQALKRPEVDLTEPGTIIRGQLKEDQLLLGIDLAGGGLHKRNYRQESQYAPLRENLAAALLWLADWPNIAQQGGWFCDPMCGSGTVVIEAALMAAKIAPGLLRHPPSYLKWPQKDQACWQKYYDAAQETAQKKHQQNQIMGWDCDLAAVRQSLVNSERAHIDHQVRFYHQTIDQKSQNLPEGLGLILTNPPYGQRLSSETEAKKIHQQLKKWHYQLPDSQRLGVFTAHPEWLGSWQHRGTAHRLWNGQIPCRLLLWPRQKIKATVKENNRSPHRKNSKKNPSRVDQSMLTPVDSNSAKMLANRLQKNERHLRRWRKKSQITCYRLYDGDLPEYNLIIDYFEDWVIVQERRAPASVSKERAQWHLREGLSVVHHTLKIPLNRLVYKQRWRQKRHQRYHTWKQSGGFVLAREAGFRFLINPRDHLDVGLFPDHTLIRQRIAELAQGRDFLNLFAYTGTATVYAIAGGARSTYTVDMSANYLRWARQNLELNQHYNPKQHHFEQQDCWAWLHESKQKFGLIFLDPPTFSNSKKMKRTLDIKRDYVELIQLTLNRLVPGGVLIFSTNCRTFKMDTTRFHRVRIQEITQQTERPDFAKSRGRRFCWQFTSII